MKIKTSNIGSVALAAALALGAKSTYADLVTIDLNYAYGPSVLTKPAYTGTLVETFQDVGANEVLLTLSTKGMSSAYEMSAFEFNLTPASQGLLGHLSIAPQNSSLSATLGQANNYGDDDGKYDFNLKLSGFGSGNSFVGGLTESYLITKSGSSETLDADDFKQLSTTISGFTPYDETVPFMATADLLAAGGNAAKGYNWLGGDAVPDGGSVGAFMGFGAMGLAALRRKMKI